MRTSLARSRLKYYGEAAKLEIVLNAISESPPKLQYLISEILLIRLSAILEEALSEIAYKVATGALYLDGSKPITLVDCRSMTAARISMLNPIGLRQKQSLKWTRFKYIKESVAPVIDSRDNYLIVCDNHSALISEVFKVRNFAAHRNTSTRNGFKEVKKSVYGRDVNMTLGYFLLSGKWAKIPNLQRYLISVRVLINDLTKSVP